MEITSPAFVEGGVIQQEFTGDGKNVSPPLSIMGVPEEAKSLVLIMDDVDAPTGVFTHWLVFDLYPGITRLGPGCSPEGTQGKHSFGKEDYGGPNPDAEMHRYYFRLYALDSLLKLPLGTDRTKVDMAMRGRVLDSCKVMGTYAKT